MQLIGSVTPTESQGVMKKFLGEEPDVHILNQETITECKTFKAIITKEEIFIVIQADLCRCKLPYNLSCQELTKSLQAYPNSFDKLPVENAGKLLENGKPKIGWVVCRIR